jgi:lipopolysaccharide/colanic/teichoic acid biosynthesis glycosyltransferase
MIRTYKRFLDLGIIILAHILFFPIFIFLWLVIPAGIYLQDGFPILYTEFRPGKDGAPFKLYKFRSMVRNANISGTCWTKEHDFRITFFGKLLRRTALDELPQLFNILKGDMSFIGPRPYPVKEQQMIQGKIPDFKLRLALKPGLTSLAEIYDPIDDPRATLKYDLEYIKRMNIWLDIKILFLSLRNTLCQKWDKRKGKEFFHNNLNSSNL